MIDHPLTSLSAWVSYFEASPIPILQMTQVELATLLTQGDSASVHRLAAIARHDALLTLEIIRYLQHRRTPHQITDVTTVERVVLMVGVDPLLNHFSTALTVETMLAHHPQALDLVRSVLQRAHHAALCAERVAAYRHDVDNAEVMTAALLRDIAEILVACFAPKLLLRVRAMQNADRTLRSNVAQKAVFGFPLIDLELALIDRWRLPEILKMLMDESQAEHPRVRTVLTAGAFARHLTHGWDDPALPDDYKAIADIAHINDLEARRACLAATTLAAQSWAWYGDTPNMPEPPADLLAIAAE